jgi:hypothetical protein
VDLRSSLVLVTEFDGERVRARLLTGGFVQAYERFQAGQAAGDAEATFRALFEALNWAHAIDDLIALTWSPRGKVEGYAWRSDPALGGGLVLAHVMDGLRYARNRVHHQWADAVTERAGAALPFTLPRVLMTWVWRPVDELPTPPKGREDERGRAAYVKALAGCDAEAALVTMSEAFEFVGSLLDPPMAVRTLPVVVAE